MNFNEISSDTLEVEITLFLWLFFDSFMTEAPIIETSVMEKLSSHARFENS